MKNDHPASRHFSETAEMLFRLSHRETIVNAFDSGKKKYRRLGMAIGAAVVLLLYFLSPYSEIRTVSIQGNDILTKDYIRETGGVHDGSPFYLTFPLAVKIKLEQDPVISSAHVTWARENRIEISIQEKKAVGYSYDGDTPYILFADGTSAPLKSEYLDVIADIPVIRGFDDDDQKTALGKAFQQVDEAVIHNMSEISRYSFAYDDEAICIQMRDGVYFLADYYNLFTINSYDAYYANMKDRNKCLYAFSNDEKNTVFETDCPWNKTEQEYWTNEDGSVMTNADGEQIPKHYYTLADGSYALDAEGNKIAIPLDENGNENPDADFQANYDAGYYSSGTLVIPEEN